MPASTVLSASKLSEREVSELLGLTQSHVVALPNHQDVKVHTDVLPALLTLIDAAREEGFELSVASGFRDFYRQQCIWNEKCLGQRPILSDDGQPLDTHSLTDFEKVQAIMRWSAIPGTSRHHWGSECDIYDANVMPEGYRLQLSPDEYMNGGLFEPMMVWLHHYLEQEQSPSFYFPYDEDRGGISPEPWHMSYRPVADKYRQQLSLPVLKQGLQQWSDGHSIAHHIEHIDTVLQHIDRLYARFINHEL